eukprot:5544811-Pyramimonas_sp.AAC.1
MALSCGCAGAGACALNIGCRTTPASSGPWRASAVSGALCRSSWGMRRMKEQLLRPSMLFGI